jgi:hypothetical protein
MVGLQMAAVLYGVLSLFHLEERELSRHEFEDTFAPTLGAVINDDYTSLTARVPAPSLVVGAGATMLIPKVAS